MITREDLTTKEYAEMTCFGRCRLTDAGECRVLDRSKFNGSWHLVAVEGLIKKGLVEYWEDTRIKVTDAGWEFIRIEVTMDQL